MPRRDVAYGYDMLDRLTSVSVYTNLQPTAYSLSTFSYDLADNRTNATHNGAATAYTLGVGDRLASTSDGATYLYSAAGCVTNISVPSVSSVVSLHWNSRYQLTAAYTNGALAESYQYDALGRRVATTTGGTTTCHVYDGGWQVLADLDASGRPLRSYTWGPGIDNLLAVTVHGEAAINTYYALTDYLGTVHALVDATGDIAESYEYDAWGHVLAVYDASGSPISNQQSAIGNRHLFQGREYSYSTGLYHFRIRWYDPATGRWLSNNPIGISGGLNQYAFCSCRPVSVRDTLGLRTNSVYVVTGSGLGAAGAAKMVGETFSALGYLIEHVTPEQFASLPLATPMAGFVAVGHGTGESAADVESNELIQRLEISKQPLEICIVLSCHGDQFANRIKQEGMVSSHALFVSYWGYSSPSPVRNVLMRNKIREWYAEKKSTWVTYGNLLQDGIGEVFIERVAVPIGRGVMWLYLRATGD